MKMLKAEPDFYKKGLQITLVVIIFVSLSQSLMAHPPGGSRLLLTPTIHSDLQVLATREFRVSRLSTYKHDEPYQGC